MASSVELSDDLKTLNLNSIDHLDVLLDIQCNYESIFSWNIYEKIGKCRNQFIDVLKKVTQKQDLIFEKQNIFSFNK